MTPTDHACAIVLGRVVRSLAIAGALRIDARHVAAEVSR